MYILVSDKGNSSIEIIKNMSFTPQIANLLYVLKQKIRLSIVKNHKNFVIRDDFQQFCNLIRNPSFRVCLVPHQFFIGKLTAKSIKGNYMVVIPVALLFCKPFLQVKDRIAMIEARMLNSIINYVSQFDFLGSHRKFTKFQIFLRSFVELFLLVVLEQVTPR